VDLQLRVQRNKEIGMFKKIFLVVLVLFFLLQFLFAEVSLDVFTLSDIGWTEELQKLLGGNPSLVHSTDATGKTPLHYAALIENPDTARVLISFGADPNTSDSAGISPLHRASYYGKFKTVAALIEGGARVNEKDAENVTSLRRAVQGGWEESVAVLLRNGSSLLFEADSDLHGNILEYALNLLKTGSKQKQAERIRIANILGRANAELLPGSRLRLKDWDETTALMYITGDISAVQRSIWRGEKPSENRYGVLDLADLAVILGDTETLDAFFEKELLFPGRVPRYIKTSVDYSCRESFEYLKKKWFGVTDLPIQYTEILHSYVNNEFIPYNEVNLPLSVNNLNYSYSVGRELSNGKVVYSYHVNDLGYGPFLGTGHSRFLTVPYLNNQPGAVVQEASVDGKIKSVTLMDGRRFSASGELVPITIIDGVFYYNVREGEGTSLWANNTKIAYFRTSYEQYHHYFGYFIISNKMVIDQFGHEYKGFFRGKGNKGRLSDTICFEETGGWSLYSDNSRRIESAVFDETPEVLYFKETGYMLSGKRGDLEAFISEKGWEFEAEANFKIEDFFEGEPVLIRHMGDEIFLLEYKGKQFGPGPLYRYYWSYPFETFQIHDYMKDKPVWVIKIEEVKKGDDTYLLISSDGNFEKFTGSQPLFIVPDGRKAAIISDDTPVTLDSGQHWSIDRKLFLREFRSPSILVRNNGVWGLVESFGQITDEITGNWDYVEDEVLSIEREPYILARNKRGTNYEFEFISENNESYGGFPLSGSKWNRVVSSAPDNPIFWISDNRNLYGKQGMEKLFSFKNVIDWVHEYDWRIGRVLTLNLNNNGKDINLDTLIFD
jgi:Ankyrin repeats (3 copies)